MIKITLDNGQWIEPRTKLVDPSDGWLNFSVSHNGDLLICRNNEYVSDAVVEAYAAGTWARAVYE